MTTGEHVETNEIGVISRSMYSGDLLYLGELKAIPATQTETRELPSTHQNGVKCPEKFVVLIIESKRPMSSSLAKAPTRASTPYNVPHLHASPP
jgi:hypothetical protein